MQEDDDDDDDDDDDVPILLDSVVSKKSDICFRTAILCLGDGYHCRDRLNTN
jgi:hypothetical protein